MAMPKVKLDIVADEAALCAALAALATSAGVTTLTAGGVTIFVSNGEDGDHLICGGFEPIPTRKMHGYVGADVDQTALVNATAKPYVNDDTTNSTALASKAVAATDGARWVARDNGQTITYLAVASKDAVLALIQYLSGGNLAQGVLYLGIPQPTAEELQAQAYGRIAAVDASTPASTIITLDRDINAALKDGSVYGSDPYPVSPLFFQSVFSGGMPVTDFALTQRIPLIAGSLTLSAGATRFHIDATAAGKLTGAPGGTNARYRAGRGVGDIVRLCAQPNIVIAYSDAATNQLPSGLQASLASWDAAGGQAIDLDLAFGNTDIADGITDNHPTAETGNFVAYRIYSMVIDLATTMLSQPDNEGRKNVGALTHFLEASFLAGDIAKFQMMRLDRRVEQIYRTIGITVGHGVRGLDGSGGLGAGASKAMLIGPGWGQT